MSLEQRLTIVGLGVDDLGVSTKFYEEVFGWSKLPSSSDTISFFQLNGILLSLYSRKGLAEDAQVSAEGSGFKGVTLAHNYRSEAEVDECFKNLEEKGAKIVKRPEKVFWGGYSGYVSDPDGHLWEIAYNPYLEMDLLGNVQ